MSTKPEMPAGLKASVEASKTEYVNLGKSGLRVSLPIFGAMSIGSPEWAPWVMDEEKVSYLLFSLQLPVLEYTFTPRYINCSHKYIRYGSIARKLKKIKLIHS